MNQTITSGSNGSSVDVSALQNQINDLDEVVSSQQVSLAELNQTINNNYADLASTEAADVTSLQAQINALKTSGTNTQDTIISNE